METAQTPELSFEKATFTGDQAAGGCAQCAGSLDEQYWQWQSRPVCASCRTKLGEMLAASQSRKAFGRALLLGGLTALGCGIAYAIFVAATDYQLALLTIGIAFVIAKVMRRCSFGVGGRKYQLLAVALTYMASAMGYMPAVISSLRGDPEQHVQAKATASAAPATRSAAPATASAGDPSQPAETAAPRSKGVGVLGLLLGVVLLFVVTLISPLLAAAEAPMGLLIVAFGLWEAWKLSAGLPLSLDGPYRVAPAPVPVPVAATATAPSP